MKKGLSPTQRTLAALRHEGRVCAIVEKFNPFGGPISPKTGKRTGIRQDLFGFIDIIVLDPTRGIGGIQSTGQGFSERLNKLLNSEATENVLEWLKAGGFIELWGWRKIKLARGGKATRWMPRIREVLTEDIVKTEPDKLKYTTDRPQT